MTKLFDLSNKVALVSGAASGMGRAMSIAAAEAGADVLIIDINEKGMQDTVATIEQLGRKAIAVRCDVAEPDQIRAAYKRLDDEFGRIDFLANVAGAARVVDAGFDDLDAPIKRLNGAFTPTPYSPTLEQEIVPQVDDIRRAIHDLLHE